MLSRRGSRRSRATSSTITTTTKTTTPSKSSGSQPARRQRKPSSVTVPRATRSRGSSSSSILSSFKNSYLNPFQFAPPKLGYDVFTTSSMTTAWVRRYAAPPTNAADTANAVFMMTPRTILDAGISAGLGGVPSFINFALISNIGTNTPLSTATTAGTIEQFTAAPTDSAYLNTVIDSFRPVTASMQVTVRYPMTSAPGRLFALRLFESGLRIGTLSVNDLVNLSEEIPFVPDGSGVSVARVNWAQADSTDFDFAPNSAGVPLQNLNVSRVVIMSLGWPSGTVYDLESFSHMEYHSGVAAGGDESDSTSPSLSDFFTKERLAQVVRSWPIGMQGSTIRATDAALALHNRQVRNFRGGRASAASAAASSFSTSGAQASSYASESHAGYGPSAVLGAGLAAAGYVLNRHYPNAAAAVDPRGML